MVSRFTELAVDSANPSALAAFWCEVLDYEVHEQDVELVTIGPRGGARAATSEPVAPVLTFARVPEAKTIKNRVHVDVRPADRSQAEEVERLLVLGARHADVGQGDAPWVVLTDPEGNEFCVLGHEPS